MNFKTHSFLKILLLGICAFNIIIGVGLNVSPEFPQLVAGYYGAEVEWTAAFMYIIKPLGAFMILTGVLACVAALDPVKHCAIIYGLALLFLMRGLQRLVFMDEIATAVNIDAARNVGNSLFFITLAVLLVIMARFAAQRSG